MSICILVANASEAHIYEAKNIRSKDLTEIKTLTHPESREKGLDLISDRPGHYQTNHSARSAYERKSPKETQAEYFAIQLCDELNLDRMHNIYEKLIIIAPPKFYGRMQKHLNKHVIEFIHIPKDYTKCKPKEIAEHIYEHLYE
jgi:protein required for attachment to host cells